MSGLKTDQLTAAKCGYDGGGPGCATPGCTSRGIYRAPVSRERLNDYHWFCLEHIREYNAGWNFFAGMSEAEIEAIRRNDTVWQRPTWPLGTNWSRAEARIWAELDEELGFSSRGADAARPAKAPLSEEEQALTALDLKVSATFTEVKTRYKKLAKQLHPDANGGDRAAEERLKVINQAYATLKKSFAQESS